MSIKQNNWTAIFDELAIKNGLEKIGKGWGTKSNDTIIMIDVQKSKYGSNSYLNLNIFLQGFGGKHFELSKELIGQVGQIFRREPPSWSSLFDPDGYENEEQLKVAMILFFKEFLVPFLQNMRTKESIVNFEKEHSDDIFLLPATKIFLGMCKV